MVILKKNVILDIIDKTHHSVSSWSEVHGFAQSTISAWINGSRHISLKQLKRLSEALHVSVSDISNVSQEEMPDEVKKINVDEFRRRYGFSLIPGEIPSDPVKAIEEFRNSLLMALSLNSDIVPEEKCKVMKIIAEHRTTNTK